MSSKKKKVQDKNLLGKLHYVHKILGSETINALGFEYTICTDLDELVGCSKVIGIFKRKKTAEKFMHDFALKDAMNYGGH